jgi:EmrB/QacA subfamily drug resistance transporter
LTTGNARSAEAADPRSAPADPHQRAPGGTFHEALRRFTKRMYPLMRPLAGRRWFGLLVVLHHIGRTTGREHATIVAAGSSGGDLIVPMTFAESSHWVHNVRAASGAEVEWKGRRYAATKPETVGYADAHDVFHPFLRIALRRLGIRSFVRLKLAPVEMPPSVPQPRNPEQPLSLRPMPSSEPEEGAAPAEADPTGTSPDSELTRNRRILVTIGVMLALLLAALDATIVGTALPRIVADLHGLDYFAWVVTAYLVAETTMTPIAGKLGDLFGRKPLLMAGMVGFVVTSSLCGLAQDMGQLIAFRAAQGIFGGTLFATVFASVADIYPPVARARMLGMLGGVFGLASIIGPTLGGLLTDNLSWRWVFYVNAPVGAVALLFVLLTMPRVRTFATWRNVDLGGAITLAGALVPLLVALSITRDHDWTSPQVVSLLAVAAVVLTAFLAIERRQADPIIPLGLFRNPTFVVSVATSFVAGIGLFATVVFVPLIYQGVLGTSATNSGALLTPLVAGLIAASVVTGQLMPRIRYYRFLGTAGIGILALGLSLLSQISTGSDSTEVVRDLVVTGFGIGMTLPLYLSAAQTSVSARLTGVVTSQVTFWRNVGATTGIAVLGSLLAQQLPVNLEARLSAVQSAGGTVAGLASIGRNAQALFDPARLATMPGSEVLAIRLALADTLHGLFVYAALAVAVSVLASVFLDDIPLVGREQAGGAHERQSDAEAALAA